ncbi:MAG TPA: ABC transporter ATP-binding protein, partial [Candidatus Binatia bacterium]|nr:ABC transporter ATP-binding protein [Candidatus Binatia bacterium]
MRKSTPAADANRRRSSRRRYWGFVADYKERRLADSQDDTEGERPREPDAAARGKRREYLRDYMGWLWPHRYAVAALFFVALLAAGLQMIEPLFMRFIIDRVLLNNRLETSTRLIRLNQAGGIFLAAIIITAVVGVLKDYRQRLLNVRVMLSLRRSLFERLIHLPLAKIWDMKTGGILSRLTGDVDTTTGLLQMALVSPAISIVRLIIAVSVLMSLNWR